jgi:uncharacterized protein (TIGR02246 family)
VLEHAFNAGDIDAYADAFEEDAVMIAPPEGRVVRGRAEIRAATEPIFALRPRASIEFRQKLESDGFALTHARWELAGTDADGARVALAGRGTMVSRRRRDGTWGIVLDNPLSPE